MNKDELKRLAESLDSWLDELDMENDSPEVEAIYKAVRDQMYELEELAN